MAVEQEECFPRGQSTSKKPALRKIKTTLFDTGHRDLPKKKVKKFKVREKNDKNLKKIKKKGEKKEISKILPLNYQRLEQGMLVLGKVREVNDLHLFVCLPGRLSAKVSAVKVSQPYTDLLYTSGTSTQQECPSLTDLFHEGQPVACRLAGVTHDGPLVGVEASLEPALVNAALRHDSARAGQPIAAAVEARQDHGYSMHTGIPGLTAFLPNAQAMAYKQTPLVVGEVLLCVVKKSKTSKECSQVKLMLASNLKSGPETGVPSNLLPGTPLSCVVKKRVSSGLVVSVGSILGFIEAAQFRSCWFDPKEYKKGTRLNATVLYVSESSDNGNPKTVYLTLKDIYCENIPKIALGQIINAEVTSANYRGIYLCLGDEKDNILGNKGIVSKRRVGDPVKMNNLRKYYPQGTRLTTRVLAYDYMEEVYNCTLEKSKLCEQYVRADEVNVGDRLLATVAEVQPQMLLLSVGAVKMAVFKEHTADEPYKDLSSHFHKGAVVRARVLRANGANQLVATLRPTLLRGAALTSFAQARVGDAYWGTVRHVRELSLLVGFYADVSGVLALEKPRAFRLHQLVRCRITYVNPLDRKLTLSLEDSQEQIKPLEVGELCELEVTGETPEHYTVVPFDHEGIVDGVLPKSHLPDQVSYTAGQSLKASLYCKFGTVHRFSNNPAIQNIFTNEDTLETSDSVTCCVEKFDLNSKWVDLYSPHPYRVFKCRRKNILANGNLSTHQIIQVSKNIMHNYNKHDEVRAEVQQNGDDKVTKKAKKTKNKKRAASNLEVISQQEERLLQVSSKTPRLSKRLKRHSESLLKNPDHKNFHTKKRKEA